MSKELLKKIEDLETELSKTKLQLEKENTLLNPNTVKGITSKGEVLIFEMDQDGFVDASFKDLVSVECGDSLKKLYISNNNLTSFECGDSLKWLSIRDNNLTSFECGDSL